jgi:hypothetical protein
VCDRPTFIIILSLENDVRISLLRHGELNPRAMTFVMGFAARPLENVLVINIGCPTKNDVDTFTYGLFNILN